MNVVFNDIRDQMDRQDAVITSLHEECPRRAPNARRQGRRARLDDSDDYHEDEFEDEDDQASLNNEGRFAPRGERRGRGFRRDPRWQDGIDRNLGNIKMKIPSKGEMTQKCTWSGRRRWCSSLSATTTLRRKR